MNTHRKKSCEAVDASVFRSDMLYNDDDRTEFRFYVERWLRAIDEHERLAKENAGIIPGDPWQPVDDPWSSP